MNKDMGMKWILRIGILVVLVGAFFTWKFIGKAQPDMLASNYLLHAGLEQQDAVSGPSTVFETSTDALVARIDIKKPEGVHFEIQQSDPANVIMEAYHEEGTAIYTGTFNEDHKFVITERER